MKWTLLIGTILAAMLLMISGCEAPTCYPPNKILDNKCCLDEDDNSVCDYEEDKEADETSTADESSDEETEPADTELDYEEAEESEPEIQEVQMPEPKPIQVGLVMGKQEMKIGESKEYLQLHSMSAYRTSRDKGLMDYMVVTVRNPGKTNLNARVELLFEGARVEEHSTRVKKEYDIPELKPGEKYVFNQSMGIRFENIDKEKRMTMTVYEKFTAPRVDLGKVEKVFIPTDYMDDLTIYTYGKSE